jgi:hypothetical protein
MGTVTAFSESNVGQNENATAHHRKAQILERREDLYHYLSTNFSYVLSKHTIWSSLRLAQPKGPTDRFCPLPPTLPKDGSKIQLLYVLIL